MKHIWSLVACIGLVGTLSSCDKDDDEGDMVNDTDRNFVVMSSMSNYAEIDAGQAASQKAANAGIRDFGMMMVNDHSNASGQLKAIALREGLNAPDSLNAEQAALKAQLAALTARAFDSVYINSQVTAHLKSIELFETEINYGQHDELTDFARSTLPLIQMHHHHADSLAAFYRPR